MKRRFNGRVLPMAGQLKNFCPNKSTVNKQKAQIMNQKLNKELSARTTDDSSTNADEMHVSPAIGNTNVGRGAGKKVSYRGYKAILPENVSMNAFKQIVEISSGFDYCIQPFINLLSNQLKSQSHVR